MSIYVEIPIRAPIDALLAHTQTPALHQKWDLRFSTIEYLTRINDASPQRFRYTTRIGFGLDVSGEGETARGTVICRMGARGPRLRSGPRHLCPSSLRAMATGSTLVIEAASTSNGGR
jgi:hypothetical protein